MRPHMMVCLSDVRNDFDPLGARCIMAVIESHGERVELLQDRLQSRNRILARIRGEAPRAIWISVQPDTPDLYGFLSTIRRCFCGPLIVGNIGARSISGQFLRTLTPDVVVVLGQGEDAAAALTAILTRENSLQSDDLREVPNLRFWSDEQLVETTSAPAGLAKTIVPSATSLSEAISRGDVISARSSSGCNFACTFCSVRSINNNQRWVQHSQSALSQWLERVIACGLREGTIRMTDDDLADNLNNLSTVAAIFAGLRAEFRVDVGFGLATRANHLFLPSEDEFRRTSRERIWNEAVKSGLTHVFLGLESGSADQLRRLGKGYPPSANFEAVNFSRRLGLVLEIGFIFLDPLLEPGLWRAELQDNLRLARYCDVPKSCPTWLAPVRAYADTSLVRLLTNRALLGTRDEGTNEYKVHYTNAELTAFMDALGPALCTGDRNGVFRFKRDLKTVQRYHAQAPRSVLNPAEAAIAAELDFVELLLEAFPDDRVHQIQTSFREAALACYRDVARAAGDLPQRSTGLALATSAADAIETMKRWRVGKLQ